MERYTEILFLLEQDKGGVPDDLPLSSFNSQPAGMSRLFYAFPISGCRPHLPGTVGDQSMAKPSVMCPEKLKRLAASFCLLVKAAMAAALWTAST